MDCCSLAGSVARDFFMSRILLIEDDALVRTTLSEFLAEFGHSVTQARDGREGLRLFRQVDPELVITDLVMPEIEGMEVLMKLQEYRSTAKIIVISGGLRGDTADFLEIAKSLGASKVLAKPFTYELLLATLNELLNTRGVSP
jgi:DNA-binding response OmpR family regulator